MRTSCVTMWMALAYGILLPRPTLAGEVTYDDLRTALAAQFECPPVAYTYTAEMPEEGQRYACRYVRHGESYHFATQVWLKDRVIRRFESAFDGERSCVRYDLNQMRVRKGTDGALPQASSPAEELFYPIRNAFELSNQRQAGDVTYRLKEVRKISDTLVISIFDRAGSFPGTFEVCHQLDRGALPLYVVSRSRGHVMAEWTDIEYAEVRSEGNVYWLPIGLNLYTQSVQDPAKTFLRYACKVDPKSIRVPDEKTLSFVLKPYPNESMYDVDTGSIKPASNPKWTHPGELPFPFTLTRPEQAPKPIQTGTEK